MSIEKRKSFLINFAYIAVIVLAAALLLQYILPMLTPFVIGFVIAYLLKRPIRFAERKLHFPKKLAAILSVLLFYSAVGILIFFLGVEAISGLSTLIKSLPTIYETHVLPFLADVFHNVESVLMRMEPALVDAIYQTGTQLTQSLGQMISNLSVQVMSLASGAASALPGLFIKLVLMIISTFFIAIDYDRLTSFCLRQMNDGTKEVFLQIKEYVVGTLLVCIRSYIIIMSITFLELSIALSLIDNHHPILVAACIAVFDILPVLGTGGIMIPWAVLTLVQGNYPLALEILLIYVVITVIRNIIEPKIVGSQLGLHPIVTLSSMFLGAQLFGVIGLFGFPILLSLLRHLNDHGVINILK